MHVPLSGPVHFFYFVVVWEVRCLWFLRASCIRASLRGVCRLLVDRRNLLLPLSSKSQASEHPSRGGPGPGESRTGQQHLDRCQGTE